MRKILVITLGLLVAGCDLGEKYGDYAALRDLNRIVKVLSELENAERLLSQQ